ncbi:hypothetical protein WN943_013226 [Citrus x changshan-huyou]
MRQAEGKMSRGIACSSSHNKSPISKDVILWQLPHVHRAFPTSIVLGRSRALTDSNYQTWENVGCRVLLSSLGRGETIALLPDRAFFLNDKLLDGTSLWSACVSSQDASLLPNQIPGEVKWLHLGWTERQSRWQENGVGLITEACSQYGFFQIVNRGIPQKLFSQAIELSKTFYGYSDDEKKLFNSSLRSGAPLRAGYSR